MQIITAKQTAGNALRDECSMICIVDASDERSSKLSEMATSPTCTASTDFMLATNVNL